jgi:hypothetical protein
MEKYESLSKVNVVATLRSIGLKMDAATQRFSWKLEQNLSIPWIENGVDRERSCLLWLNLYFKHFAFIPRKCFGCWKTYCNPSSLKELVEIYEFQQKESRSVVDIPCKCGIETRPFTGNLGGYAAFWYNPLGCSLADARVNTNLLSDALGKKLALKRGCTEMEQWTRRRFGLGSDKWDKLLAKETEFQEAMLDALVRIEGKVAERMPTAVVVDVKQRWIEHAAMHGDSTYLEYTNSSMFPKLVNYISSKHNAGDFPGWRESDEGKQDHNGVFEEKVGGEVGQTQCSRIESIA